MKSGRWETEYKRLLRAMLNVLSAPLNDRMELFFEAAGNALGYKTAEELLRAFIFSTRILQDMLIYLQLEDNEMQNFVFREWVYPWTQSFASSLSMVSSLPYQNTCSSYILLGLSPHRTLFPPA
jgi:hypothetical protein